MRPCSSCKNYKGANTCARANVINRVTGKPESLFCSLERSGWMINLGCIVSEGRAICGKKGRYYEQG